MKNDRLATKHDLDCVNWQVQSSKISQTIKQPRAAQLATFCAALYRMGFSGIRAPIGALADSQRRAGGRPYSERSIYRALSDLSAARLVSRTTPKFGQAAALTTIKFDSDRFSKLCAIKPYKRLHLPNWQTVEKKEKRIQNKESVVFVTKSIPQLKEKTQKPQNRFAEWQDPICYSVKRVNPRLVRAAELDLERARHGKTTVIDWSYWSPRWQTLPIAQRERQARQFATALLDTPPPAPRRVEQSAPAQPAYIPSLADISALVMSAMSKRPALPDPSPPPPEMKYPEIKLDPADLRILQAAARQAERRRRGAT